MALFVIVVVASDLYYRVLPSDTDTKDVVFTDEALEELTLKAPEKPGFNKHLFGQIKETDKPEGQAKKVVPKEPKLQLLAIYSTPEPYAFVNASNRKWPAKKLKAGEVFAGYKLVKVTKSGAVFEKAGKSQELKVFKR
ncbi:hypothetical protein [Pseudoalteromonas sp. P1-9]|uniref:hypothetical protein n=1 Tax=Pseudoalteromonas sp. P1-9 TaxID=1710354 RepID=UPI00128F4BF3|nr:hypothetical protein [Pseudoalteromonas sp. P1-9]